MTKGKRKKCKLGYGSRSLSILRKAKERGMHLNIKGQVVTQVGKVHVPNPHLKRDRLTISIDDERITMQTARAICFLAFGEPPTPMSIADHLNGDTLDNSIENLRWATYSENTRNQKATRVKTFEQRAIEACANLKDPEKAVPMMQKALTNIIENCSDCDDGCVEMGDNCDGVAWAKDCEHCFEAREALAAAQGKE